MLCTPQASRPSASGPSHGLPSPWLEQQVYKLYRSQKTSLLNFQQETLKSQCVFALALYVTMYPESAWTSNERELWATVWLKLSAFMDPPKTPTLGVIPHPVMVEKNLAFAKQCADPLTDFALLCIHSWKLKHLWDIEAKAMEQLWLLDHVRPPCTLSL